jgi:hypothetical protein
VTPPRSPLPAANVSLRELWTNLQSLTETRHCTRSGVYDFKPYVHSDCGGDHRPEDGGDLLRWTAHCAFGSILRFHGAAHQPWSYDTHTEDVIREYLTMRWVPLLVKDARLGLLCFCLAVFLSGGEELAKRTTAAPRSSFRYKMPCP